MMKAIRRMPFAKQRRRTHAQRIDALVEMAHDAIASEYVAHMSAVNTEAQLDELIDEWEAARAARIKGR